MAKEAELSRLERLESLYKRIESEIIAIKRKHQIGIYCCKYSEQSNGWGHDQKYKNWILTY